jgi:hypothetical protein
MMKLFRILPIAVVVFSVSAIALGQEDWVGLYTFDEDGGKNAGGSAIFISHELNIFADAGKLVATLQSNGYQTSTDLICSAKAEGPKLMLYFQSYGENNMFEPYKPGDHLLTLERKTEKGKNVVVTQWVKFTPAIPNYQKPGKVYFSKVTNADTSR